MNIYTPLAFFAFILAVFMGIFVIRKDSRNPTNRVFLGLAISMAIWNLAYMFVYPDTDKSHVFFWYKIAAIGWCNFPSFVLHFFLLLAQKKPLFDNKKLWILLYLPGIIFTIKALQGGFLAADFKVGPGNAIYEIQNTQSVWYTVYVLYLWVFILYGILVFVQYSRKSTLRKIKMQSRIFLVAVLLLFSAISTTNLILPSLKIEIIPAVGNIILIFWMLTIWYAILKYKLMSFTVKSAANKLISKMKELLFFVDTEGKIIRINDFTRNTLALHTRELINTNFYELVEEGEKIKHILENIDEVDSVPELNLNLKYSDGRKLPVNISLSAIKDKTGDLLGALIVGHDITLTLQLQKELEFHKEAELKIQQQNEVLLAQKEELLTALENLKNTQNQLVQSEKMASLGELTAGIAHEIQNPLNFVNNFAEVSFELIAELKEELLREEITEALFISDDLKLNLEKITQYGRRADAIVKNMIQNSLTSLDTKEPVDLNALADECLGLTWFGLKAKDEKLSVKLTTGFDPSVGKIRVVPQEIGRVFTNILKNAFWAVSEKGKTFLVTIGQEKEAYEPFVSINTKNLGNKIEIRISDNGTGISPNILGKIFQPFFTTKPAGQGTGLGLSVSYDIITKGHGGEIRVETEEGEGTTFIIIIPDSL